MDENIRNPGNEKPLSLHPLTPEEALAGLMQVKPEKGGETMPKFKVDDVVVVPTTDEFSEIPLKGASGTVQEVRPGTGYKGKRPDAEGKLSEWPTPHIYVVDFGSPIGLQEVAEELLEFKPSS